MEMLHLLYRSMLKGIMVYTQIAIKRGKASKNRIIIIFFFKNII